MTELVDEDLSEQVNSILQAESEDLAQKRKQAEEKRKKRAMFLNNIDSFSQEFETKTLVEEQQRKEAREREKALLASQIKSTSEQYQAGPQQAFIVKENETIKTVSTSPEVVKIPEPVEESAKENDEDTKVIKLQGGGFGNLDALAADLLATSQSGSGVQSGFYADEELSVPTRIGGEKKKKNQTREEPVPKPLVQSNRGQDIDTDDEGAGDINTPHISHFLTKEERKGLSAEQKIAWKALQADMTSKRKGRFLHTMMIASHKSITD